MKTLPDQVTAVVGTADGPARISWIAALQPDDPSLVRACITLGPGRAIKGLRLLRGNADAWRDEGPAPSMRDDSWHPEIPESLAEGIEMARRVIAMLPRCHSVLIAPEVASTSKGFRVGSGAIFYGSDENGDRSGIVGEQHLDRTPFVRLVERLAEDFAEWLHVLPHDDGSGVSGDLSIDVSPTHLFLVYDDESDGGVLSITSEFVEGQWNHATVLRMPIYEDAVGILRAVADPGPQISSFAAESDIWRPILRSQAEVDVHHENRVLVLQARPGTLLRDRD